MRRATVILFCVFLPAVTRAAEIRVHWELHGAVAATNAARLTFRSLSSPQAVDLVLPLDGAKADVPAGQWSVDVDNPEWWHARQYVRFTDASTDLTIPLWRSATLSGTAALRDGTALKELTVHFAASNDALQGETSCPVMNGHFRCKAAAGLLDLRVRSRGCIAQYVWGKNFPAGQPADLGGFVFERGAAITGSVALGHGVKTPLQALRVRAFPDSSQSDRNRMQQVVAAPTPRGFFHLDGIPPGQYVVRVEGAGKVTSAPVRVTVVGTAEAQLREPLLADVPRQLTVAVTPARDPDETPWIVTIEHEVSRHAGEVVAQHAVDRDGIWQTGVQPGAYSVKVSSLGGAVWASRDVEVQADEHVSLLVLTRTLRGKVLLGRKPLAAAALTFGGEFGTLRIPVTTDQEGSFRVRLPGTDAAEWDVTVDAPAPRVKRTLRVAVPQDDEKDVVLQLRDTVVMGTVVDETGARARDVLVNMSNERELIQVDAGAEGAFAFHGVEPGAYTLQAEGYLLESDAMELTVPEEAALDEVRLIVRNVHKVVGRVYSAAGPVAGARVTIMPVDVPAINASTRETDEQGEFSATAPPNCRRVDVFVLAPGFAFKAFRTTLRDDQALNIPVDQRGGSLTARWRVKAGEIALLFHAGAMFWPETLVEEWSGRRVKAGEGDEIVSAPLEPGPYTLCLLGDDAAKRRVTTGDSRCVDAFLPPFGEVVLERP